MPLLESAAAGCAGRNPTVRHWGHAVMTNEDKNVGLRDELRVIAQRSAQVWGLLPKKDKKVLALAALMMALASASSTAVALVLGKLVDAVTSGLQNGAD